MRILVEALGIGRFGGGRSATLNLFETLIALAPAHDFIFLLEEFEPTLDHPQVRQIVVPIRNRFAARLWLQANLPRLVLKKRVDLVHFAKNLLVFGLQAKTIVTLYDLTLLRFPAGFSRIDQLYWKVLQPVMLRRVDKIHAISQNTANDLKALYNIPEEQIKVIYPPYHPSFRPLPFQVVEQIRARYLLPSRSIMHIGSFGPKKNLDTLVKAFALLANSFEGKLVLVGGPYRPGDDVSIKTIVNKCGLRKKVLFTGVVPFEDLPGLMNAATLIVYPSLHEGFGIVAVEAMSCGAPLIVSAGGALQEVVKDSAMVIDDPYDINRLAVAMEELCANPALRRTLHNRGLDRAKLFAPHIVANQMLSLYHRVVEHS